MPLCSPWMNRFIFGFHRRVWCPKWTPASMSCFMVTTASAIDVPVLRLIARVARHDAARAVERESVHQGMFLGDTAPADGGDGPGFRPEDMVAVAVRDRRTVSLPRPS